MFTGVDTYKQTGEKAGLGRGRGRTAMQAQGEPPPALRGALGWYRASRCPALGRKSWTSCPDLMGLVPAARGQDVGSVGISQRWQPWNARRDSWAAGPFLEGGPRSPPLFFSFVTTH